MNAPNILLIVSDQERQRDWLPDGYPLPNRQRLIDAGLEFTNYYTHTSPCSPSRATLFTGQYMAEHGVTENSTGPHNPVLSYDTPTLGHILREQGYTTAYKGKWHLENTPFPNMEAYGFGDWEGNDQSWWGLAGTGTEYDGPIAEQSAAWIRAHADDDQPLVPRSRDGEPPRHHVVPRGSALVLGAGAGVLRDGPQTPEHA